MILIGFKIKVVRTHIFGYKNISARKDRIGFISYIAHTFSSGFMLKFAHNVFFECKNLVAHKTKVGCIS